MIRSLRPLLAALGLSLAASAAAQPLTVDDAIRLALQKNQTLKVSAFAPDIARANVLAEYGRFDPALTFRRDYSNNETPLTSVSGTVEKRDSYDVGLIGATPWGLTYNLGGSTERARGAGNGLTDQYVTFGGLSVTQPLLRGFGFGANLAGLRIAKADRGIADWQHRQNIIDTITNVVRVYTTVIQARENLRISRLSRDLISQLVSQYEKRNQAGAISDADVIFARSRLASREENVLFDLRSVADAENELRLLIGETDFFVGGSGLELEPLTPAPPLTVDPASDLRRAYELRPDFQAARLGLTKRKASASLAQNQLLPRVDFVGSYGYTGIDRDFTTSRDQVRDREVRGYSAGVVVSVPLTFAEGRGRARAAKLGVKQSEADITRLELDIAVDVAAAAGQLETTRLRVAANRQAVDLAQQSLTAEQKKIDAGTGRPLELITAQDQLTQVQRGYARALADERRARADYERIIGATLETRGLKVE